MRHQRNESWGRVMNLWRDGVVIVKALNEWSKLKVKVQRKQSKCSGKRQSSSVNPCLISQIHCAATWVTCIFMEAMTSLYNSVIYLKRAREVKPPGSLFICCHMPCNITDAVSSCSLAGTALTPMRLKVMILICGGRVTLGNIAFS